MERKKKEKKQAQRKGLCLHLAPANAHGCLQRGDLNIPERNVCWSNRERLDVIVEQEVCHEKLELVDGEEATRAGVK
jgi:hypothetical protein